MGAGRGRTIGEAGGEVERDDIVEQLVDKVSDELIFVGGHQKEKYVGSGRRRVRMRKGKIGYKTRKRAGSLCELKPTEAARTFQCDGGPTGVNVPSVGNVGLMEYEYEHTVCMKPIGGPPTGIDKTSRC
jgi:hypothetical protein